MPSSINVMRTIGIPLLAVALHCLGSTGAGAQLRGLGGGVPSVGGAVGGVGSAVGGVSSGVGSTVGGSGIGGSGGGGTDLGGTDLGGSGVNGSGALGLGVTNLGGMPAPTLSIPLPGPAVPSEAAGTVKGVQATASSAARATPVNTVTNSLAGSVTGAASRTTNTLLGPTGNPIAPLGAASRQLQNTDPRNRSGVPPAGERRYVAREVVIGLASDMSPRALDDLARRHRLAPIEAQQIALIGTTYHRWRIDDGRSVSDVIRALEADGVVRTAQPNYRFTLAQSPPAAGRPDAAVQYAPEKLHLAEAHRFATGEKVLVAVINSGIDTSHPEIANAVADRYDAAPAGPPHYPRDRDGRCDRRAVADDGKRARRTASRHPRFQRRRRQVRSHDGEHPQEHRLGHRPRRAGHQHELRRSLRSRHLRAALPPRGRRGRCWWLRRAMPDRNRRRSIRRRTRTSSR